MRTDDHAAQPWETMQPALDDAAICQLAKTYKIGDAALMEWYTAFTAAFSQGPDAFIPWYLFQHTLWEHGLMRFKPFAPERVYPSLGTAEWFRNHPYWQRQTHQQKQ